MAAGRSRAMLTHTKTGWAPTDLSDNNMMSALYWMWGDDNPLKGFPVFSNTPPGEATINTDFKKVEVDALAHGLKYQDTFYDKLARGPQHAAQYLRFLHTHRAENEELLKTVFSDIRKTNRDIENYWTKHVAALKGVKIVSNLVVAFGPAAPLAANIQIGHTIYEVLTAPTLEAGNLVIIDKGVEKAVSDLADASVKKEFGKGLSNWKLAQQAEKKIAELENSLARKSSSSKIAKIGRKLDRAKSASAASRAASSSGIKSAKRIHIGKRFGLPIVFALPELYDLYQEIESLHDN
ncbi:hypothetical protein D2V07_17240 [Aurantiacibacter zhengii]|uniref:Uncharacterized protein n=2 Tax=Aurantiacibacter zhengii TaxID=2307003 RepID=A0A418NN18_9SPHN|nr:hypothetical protein D2V07_17240 [Aurantiacibacter zhengii]